MKLFSITFLFNYTAKILASDAFYVMSIRKIYMTLKLIGVKRKYLHESFIFSQKHETLTRAKSQAIINWNKFKQTLNNF